MGKTKEKSSQGEQKKSIVSSEFIPIYNPFIATCQEKEVKPL